MSCACKCLPRAWLLTNTDPPILYLSHDKQDQSVQLKSRCRILAQSIVLHLRDFKSSEELVHAVITFDVSPYKLLYSPYTLLFNGT